MFGAYRLVLALMDALNHFGLIADGFQPGQWAVVGFYVLSGFLMSRQFKKLAAQGGWRAFYVDRALRILPLYWLVTSVAWLVVPVSWTAFGLNMALLPLDYASFLRTPLIIWPAWSLACETHFYLLVPLLVMASSRILHLAIAASLMIFCVSVLLPHNAFWAYGGLPGILFTFLTGILIDRGDWKFPRWVYGILGLVLVACLACKAAALSLRTGININVAIGYLSVVPVTFWLGRLSPRVKWDQRLGLLSFPLFLVHGPAHVACMRYFQHLGWPAQLALALVISALLVVAVEKPFDHLRHRARKKFVPARFSPLPQVPCGS